VTLTLRTTTDDGARGRSFAGTVLACATSDGLWELGAGEGIRPIMIMLATTAGEVRALTENLRAGQKSRLFGDNCPSKGEPVEFKKKGGYTFPPPQVIGGYSVITAYLPGLFHFHTGLVDDMAKLVLMPWRDDLDALYDASDVPEVLAHLRALGMKDEAARVEAAPWRIGFAVMFARYLLQRSERPIPLEPTFAVQVYAAMRDGETPLLSEPSSLLGYEGNSHEPGSTYRRQIRFRAYVAPGAGVLPGAALLASQERIAEVLAAETLRFEKARRKQVRSIAPRSLKVAA